MNRIEKLFRNKSKDVLAVYFTAGFPSGENVSDTATLLAGCGVDLIEIGMPFSDPLADGPVIQESSLLALQGGMNMNQLFAELKALRSTIEAPVVLMGYLNPVLQFGMEKFLSECGKVGIDGVILPDLPVEVYVSEYKPLFEKYKVFPVFLICPSTPVERANMISAESKGFVYVVSSSSTTGAVGSMSSDQQEQLNAILNLIEGIPAMVGFGIHDYNSFKRVTENATGGIIGSAFIREQIALGSSSASIKSLIKKVKNTSYDYSTL